MVIGQRCFLASGIADGSITLSPVWLGATLLRSSFGARLHNTLLDRGSGYGWCIIKGTQESPFACSQTA